MNTPHVRLMEERDLGAVGSMAGALVRFHHALDAHRFLLVDGVEEGYARYFRSQLEEPGVVLLVAERGETLLGYAYARLEPRDWNALLDACGALHDIYVVEGHRRTGAAQALLVEVRERLRALGAPRVVLATAVQNAAALHLFEKFGFRRTMIEMTLELGGGAR